MKDIEIIFHSKENQGWDSHKYLISYSPDIQLLYDRAWCLSLTLRKWDQISCNGNPTALTKEDWMNDLVCHFHWWKKKGKHKFSTFCCRLDVSWKDSRNNGSPMFHFTRKPIIQRKKSYHHTYYREAIESCSSFSCIRTLKYKPS